jgi:acetyl esterase/lipase
MRFILGAALVGMAAVALAADRKPVVLDVWPGPAPGEKGDIGPEHVLPPQGGKPVERLTDVTRPTISIYQPAKPTGTAVLICPGGGYSILAMDLEGEEVAAWLNSIGVTGVVLKYRVPARKDQPKHLAPLEDAQRAISLLRSRADQWKIDPHRIGILGFSAGGHLAATTSTNSDRRSYDPADDVDRTSCRPDFTVLVYPAYLIDHDRLSPEIRVSRLVPPTFFVHAADDPISPENSIQMFRALRRAKVPAELHVYASGGHGFGLRPTGNPCAAWPQRCGEWLRSQGLLGGGGGRD